MNDQHFQGPVGQVAGRDIVNVGITDLWSFDAETLQNELQRCKRKLWEARSALLLNVPLFGLIATAIGGGALQLWMVFRMGGQLAFDGDMGPLHCLLRMAAAADP